MLFHIYDQYIISSALLSLDPRHLTNGSDSGLENTIQSFTRNELLSAGWITADVGSPSRPVTFAIRHHCLILIHNQPRQFTLGPLFPAKNARSYRHMGFFFIHSRYLLFPEPHSPQCRLRRFPFPLPVPSKPHPPRRLPGLRSPLPVPSVRPPWPLR